MRIYPRVLSAMVVIASVLFAAANAAPRDDIYLRPGQLVSADGATLNLYCTGSGSPAVVLDAGHQDWAPAWAVIQPQIATWTRVCSFDRPGYGFSPPGPLPRTSERITTELHDTLHKLGIMGPYLLVGHAYGATNMRAFAFHYLSEVQGLVLIDPDQSASPEMAARNHNFFVKQAAEIQQCRDALADHVPSPPELACDKRFFRGFPDPAWSDALNAALANAVHTRPDLSDAANAELEELPGDEFYLLQLQRSLGARPVRVITAAQHRPETIAAQGALLALSSNARQIFASHSRNSYVQFDEPKLVLDAISEAAGRPPAD
jgi:pimeloyl-ACP methyl ester carboxylesterase